MTKISIIGFGNVGYHLSYRFLSSGINIHQIIKRTEQTETLPSIFDTVTFSNRISDLDQHAEIVIIAVKDDQIETVANHINSNTNALIVHCAGSVPGTCLQHFQHYGVFYPLQTFTKGILLNDAQFPICIVANTDENQSKLIELARQISTQVTVMTDSTRKKIHLGAVVVNNFSNFLFSKTQEYCTDNRIDFNLLLPLMYETIHKLRNGRAIDLQTGPARRNDLNTINEHVRQLENWTELQEVYSFLSNMIIEQFNKLDH